MPHVPPLAVLTRFLEDPDGLEKEYPDLAMQIQSCPVIQKVLEGLKAPQEASPWESGEDRIPVRPAVPVRMTPEGGGFGLQSGLAASKIKSAAEGKEDKGVVVPQAGDLCATSPKLPYWDGKQAHTRMTFQPPTILLLGKYQDPDGATDCWRAAPVVPSFTAPEDLEGRNTLSFMAGDYQEYVALLDFTRPVLPSQITKVLSPRSLHPKELERLEGTLSSGGLLSFLQPLDPTGFWAQEALRAAQLDCQREFDETLRDFFRNFDTANLVQDGLRGLEKLAEPVEDEAEPVEEQVAAYRPDDRPTHQFLLLSSQPENFEAYWSQIIWEREGEAGTSWEIPLLGEIVDPGTPFFLVQKSTSNVCGNGLLERLEPDGDEDPGEREDEAGLRANLVDGDLDSLSMLRDQPDDFFLVASLGD
jgi:hypothetical protein